MQVDGMLGGGFDAIGDQARQLEADGYDGGITAEMGHDPFFPLLLAAQATERLELGTGVAIAFARTPMTLAMVANDLQLASQGRFALGIGSQIKPHIERRFSMPWSHPAPRMREFVLAMRAIWSAWHTGEKLDFRGEFYTHTLMTPFFSPGPNPYGPPKVMLAAVGDKMTEVAGEVADGMILHPFTTERYVREVTLGVARARVRGRGQDPRRLHARACRVFLVTGTNDEEWAAARKGTREQIAFYGSTPGLPRRAAAARLGGGRPRAEPAVAPRRVGGDGRAHHRRDARDVRGGRPARRARRRHRRPLRRRARPGQLRRPLRLRPRSCGRAWSPT